ncbi:MAG: PKD domain-containing protein [Nitrospiraceae bacterium]|nr:PKD domain-containing protein [Nitrospiraceae bacterium]
MTSFLKRLLLPVFLLLAVAEAAFCFLPPAFGQEGPVLMPGGPVPLILDPTVSKFRVAPESHPQIMRPMATAITVSYVPAGSYGTWGDLCEAWPPAAQTAFSYAVGIWEGYLNASGPIVVEACWTDMGSNFILGHGGTVWTDYNFSSAPFANTLYPGALVNALSGSDGAPSWPEIAVAFNKNFSWYFGTDGNPGANVDFVSVVLHEICHGLGFLGSMNVSGNQGSWGWSGIPYAYDRFAVNGAGQSLINTAMFPNPSAALGTALTNNNVYFNGTSAVAANGGSSAKLYAPAPWSPGSSYAHLDYDTYTSTPNALMVYMISYGTSIHDPGPVTLGVLKDIGWSLAETCTYSINPQINSFNLNGGSGSVSITAGAGCAWTAISNNASWLHVTSGASGTGGGTVGYSVDQYTGTGSRQGTMTIAGQTFTVNQTGCTYGLSPGSSPIFTSAGASGQTFSVTTNGTICPWTAAESLSWVSITSGASGTGNGTVTYTVDPYSSVPWRSGNINVADKSFAITQHGLLPTANFSGSPASGNTPFQVFFSDSSGNATSWLWDFGDGGSSTLQNPTHTYQTTGNPFAVTLTATNINGSDSVTKTITASSCANGPVRRTGFPDYTSIQDAYTAIGPGGADTIYIQAVEFSGPAGAPTFDQNEDVILRGGYDCAYHETRIPDTIIEGPLTIADGTVTFDQIVVK